MQLRFVDSGIGERRFKFIYRERRDYTFIEVENHGLCRTRRAERHHVEKMDGYDRGWIRQHSHPASGTADIELGVFHPRMWRPGLTGESPALLLAGTTQVLAHSANAAKLLLDRLRDIFGTVEPHVDTMAAWGHRIRDVLLLACMEVEAAWTGILRANGYSSPRPITRDYVKLCSPMLLADYEVSMSEWPDVPAFRPFGNWDSEEPTVSLDWYRAHNATKHDRESSFAAATLERAIHAVGAVVVMLHAQFGPETAIEEMSVRRVRTRPEAFYLPSLEAGGGRGVRILREAWRAREHFAQS